VTKRRPNLGKFDDISPKPNLTIVTYSVYIYENNKLGSRISYEQERRRV